MVLQLEEPLNAKASDVEIGPLPGCGQHNNQDCNVAREGEMRLVKGRTPHPVAFAARKSGSPAKGRPNLLPCWGVPAVGVPRLQSKSARCAGQTPDAKCQFSLYEAGTA
jgi:hypothetical protein